MAKKTPVKKSRRRLKRSIRRSLAAVLMITAIGVAAIPVPENYAQNEDGISPYADDDYPELPYGYPEDPKWTSVTNSNLVYTGKDEDLTVAYIINALSDGTYQRDWQFKFFKSPSKEGGIIKEYNSKYQQDRVELKANVACDYAIVETDTFDKFFTEDAHAGDIFTYTVKNPTTASGGEDDTFFKEWFTDEYDSYCKGYAAAYEDYQKRHQAWVEGPEDSRGEEPTEPVFTKTLAQIDLQKKYEYYCTYAEKGIYKGCKLAVVIDADQLGADGKNKRVYIPQELSEGSLASSLLMTDDQGFVYRTDASIIGIGNEAFAKTTNVKYLTVPKEIKYIGVSAFEHSFLKEIKLINVQDVCDKAFKNCSDLTSVEIGDGAQKLGAESFYGTGISELTFPSSVSAIGPGAFAECTFLQKIDFSAISGEFSVDDYAFYNTLALNSVNVMINENVTVRMVTLGHCAFAADGVATGALTDFTFPAALKSIANKYTKGDDSAASTGLGDYVLAGRTNMLRVIMPEGIGSGTVLKIPDGTLYGCYNLEYIRFPDASSRARYDSARDEKTGNVTGLFQSVTNPKFYVWGPELDLSTRNPANPRTCTWTAVTVVRDTVPYRYDRGEQQFYEISDGTYLLCVDNNGVLTSCTRMNTNDNLEGKPLIDLPIPALVGETVVTAIATNCFSDDVLNQHVRSVTIEDGSKIATINDGVFQGWGKLKEVYIGNSVTSIGNNAFKDCTELNDVTFSSPLNGHESFVIGTDAFKTQSQKLTFHGDIVQGYAPFEWAMKPENEIGADGLRICYKSLAPDYLTVMYNPITGLVTLLDYPKFSEIETLLYDAHAKEIKDLGYKSYVEWRVETIYADYGLNNKDWNPTRQSFAAAWKSAQTEEAQNALYSSSSYGPWITPDFCAEWEEWTEKIPDNRASAEEDGNKLTDWLFKPIVAYAAEEGPSISRNPKPYFERNKYIVAQADTNPYAAQEERDLIDSTKNIEIPAGVQSIDVYGFVKNLTADGGEKTGPESNTKNANTYLWAPSGWDSASWDMYEKTVPAEEGEDGIDSVPGLFSGFYEDGSAALSETRKRGNDVITTVTMHTIEYLPKYAFDSCENLYMVTLGPELANLGKAPFRGCYSLQTVTDNDYYTTVNGIVYSNNSDGSFTIEECLAARGGMVGQAYISADSDPNIKSVSAIKEGAFEDCDYITGVDFDRDNTAGLTVIPKDCFKNSDSLGTVVLPVTVNSVKSGAFVGANKLGSLTVYGREVDIDDNAFDTAKVEHKQWTTVQAYPDSAVVRYVDRLGEKYGLRYDDAHPLGEWWSVSFYDANYELIEDLKDKDDEPLENPQYVKNGDKATEPQDMPNTDDWVFERWVGMNNLKLRDPIYDNAAFYAQGHSTSGMVNGRYPVTFWDTIDGKQVGPTQEILPGESAIPPAHPVHTGYDPNGYSADYTNVQSPLTILMYYKPIGTSGSGTGTGTGTGSGGTTQTPSGSTSNTSGSSSSTTSSSTSSSSTSTSSSTSGSDGAVGKYTVTVENGSGSGTYDVGATVIIAANTPAAGMVFQKWTTESNGVALASVSMTATTFVMPANNVTVTANYVVGGTGGTSNISGNGNTGNSGNTGNNGNTRVDITKPGISNKDLATANVNGSTDNFIVRISETDEATRAVAEALTNKYGSLENILYYAMDISLYDSTGTVKITNTQGLSVDITIPIPDALVAYGGNNMAGAVINGNQLENLNENFTTINGVPCIRFTATHFSPYTIYVDTGNLTEGMLDTTPKTGDPIHPKWFLSIGLACLSVILFMKKDKAVKVKTA